MSASEYYRVSPRYWEGDRHTWTDREKLLGLYLLTCKHRSTEGLYLLPVGYAAVDLGWTPEEVEDVLDHLAATGFVMYDPGAHVVLLPKALKRQRPTTEKQIAGAVKSLALVPKSQLWKPFLAACAEHAPTLAKALTAEYPDNLETLGQSQSQYPLNTHSNGVASRARAHTHSSSSSSSSKEENPKPQQAGASEDQRTSREEARTVNCPKCQALTGQPCQGKDGDRIQSHAGRHTAAIEAGATPVDPVATSSGGTTPRPGSRTSGSNPRALGTNPRAFALVASTIDKEAERVLLYRLIDEHDLSIGAAAAYLSQARNHGPNPTFDQAAALIPSQEPAA